MDLRKFELQLKSKSETVRVFFSCILLGIGGIDQATSRLVVSLFDASSLSR